MYKSNSSFVADTNVNVCDLDMDAGTRDAKKPRIELWYHHNNTCRKFIYAGVGGNKNRFESEEECKRTCLGK